MKKKIEAELVSLAHRLLKMNNYKDTVQLHNDVKKLYDQLTLLRFYEENFTTIESDMGIAAFEEKAEKVIVGTIEIPEEELEDEVVELASPENIEKIEQELMENVKVTHEAPVFNEVVSDVVEVVEDKKEVEAVILPEPIVEAKLETTTTETPKESTIIGTKVTKQITIDEVLVHDYQDTLFVKKEDIIPVPVLDDVKIVEEQKVEEVKPESVVEEVKPVVEEPKVAAKTEGNVGKGIVLTLNDKIAFEKNLFAGNTEDLNRVISQLNSFTSLEEAKSFVLDFVKPDYNNWAGKEEYETRFLEIVENKFK
ncbi:hypothetical protein [Flavobacterium sp.]|uniref:hypothetical protein n=1 Tax=Flavobacterium sp. TaxID=239 RepID=UPI0035B26466